MASGQRVVVVTGANKGIGFAIARKVVETDNTICVVAARSEALGTQACQELTQFAKGGPSAVVFRQLDLSDDASIDKFATDMEAEYGRVDSLVNNAGFAYKGSDPTPFEQQAAPTFATNFYGTVQFTERMLSLLKKSAHGRIVFVASSSGHLSIIPDAKLRRKFSSPDLTKQELMSLANQFVQEVQEGRYKAKGWPASNYGMSKLCVIAYARILANELALEGSPHGAIVVSSCCPGYVATDMSSHRGPLTTEEGARTPYKLALQLPDDAPTGEFWKKEEITEW